MTRRQHRWTVRVERRADRDRAYRPLPLLTEASARHIASRLGVELHYRSGELRRGEVVYEVLAEADTLEEAVEKAERAARMAEEALLLY